MKCVCKAAWRREDWVLLRVWIVQSEVCWHECCMGVGKPSTLPPFPEGCCRDPTPASPSLSWPLPPGLWDAKTSFWGQDNSGAWESKPQTTPNQGACRGSILPLQCLITCNNVRGTVWPGTLRARMLRVPMPHWRSFSSIKEIPRCHLWLLTGNTLLGRVDPNSVTQYLVTA